MEIITRAKAVERGLLRYFTGKRCKHGHVAERFVSSRNCCDCASDGVKKSRHNSPEKWRAYASLMYAKNREREIERSRRYYQRERESIRQRSRSRYFADAARFRSAARRYRDENQEEVREQIRRYRAANAAAMRERTRKWRSEHPDRAHASTAKRRARKLQALPQWFSELDALVWEEAADLVQLRRAITGKEWHADHMIPLACKEACGLHVWNNCQVIPAKLNGSKGSSMTLTEPMDWLKSFS